MSGQDQASSVLAWRAEKDTVSSRELGDEINHFISELRNEEVLKKFVTIHLAPSGLKSKIREKLHLNGREFQTAVKMICDADDQERRMRARNFNYNYATNSNPNRPVQARQQQSWAGNNYNYVCSKHRDFGPRAYLCLDPRRCSIRHLTIPRPKNEDPNSSQ